MLDLEAVLTLSMSILMPGDASPKHGRKIHSSLPNKLLGPAEFKIRWTKFQHRCCC